MQKEVTINQDQKLFVIPSGSGYTCLGFDVLEKRCVYLSRELGALGYSLDAPAFYGTIERYQQYSERVEIARKHHEQTGWKSKSELTPELVGLEGKRVEVVTSWGEKARFIVGKSTGWIPCHLEIKRRDSSGGGAVCGSPFQSIRVVG